MKKKQADAESRPARVGLEVADVADGIQRLADDLEVAVSLDGVSRPFAAVVGVAKFLKRVGAPLDRQMIFVDLAMALSDLRWGITDPLLRASKTGNRSDPGRQWRARKDVAVLLAALIRCGMQKRAAARFLAGQLNDFAGLISSSDVKDAPGTALSWLDDFQKKNGPRDWQEQFDKECSEISTLILLIDGLGEPSARAGDLTNHWIGEWVARRLAEVRVQGATLQADRG